MDDRRPDARRPRTRAPLVSWLALLAIAATVSGCGPSEPAMPPPAADVAPTVAFALIETDIDGIHAAIKGGSLTATELVEAYLERIKAYNGTCVKEPNGMLGRIEAIPNAGQFNALATLNSRPAAREQWGFDARKARSMQRS